MKTRYTRRVDKMAYRAGYSAGYAGKPNRVDLRGEDAGTAYLRGYRDDESDRRARARKKAQAA